MSTLTLQLERCLRALEPAKAAELSAAVLRLVEAATPAELEAAREARWQAVLKEVAGSIPDFPDDFEEMPWETDREKLF